MIYLNVKLTIMKNLFFLSAIGATETTVVACSSQKRLKTLDYNASLADVYRRYFVFEGEK